MKKVRILAFIGFFLISLLSRAQEYTFRVLANKGANEVKSGDSWQPLKTGAQLKIGDELKVSDNASVGLVHKSGKPLEVKQAKTYSIAELDQKVGSGGTSVLNKYTDFILSSNSAEAKKNRLSATGAVHRGLEDIKVFLPENQYAEIFNNTAIINWESSKGGAPYVVSVKNMFDEELSKIETPENSVQIDLSDPKFANETAVLVEVRSKADGKSKSDQHLIKKLAPGRLEVVKKQLNEEATDLKEETAFNKYLLASVYEEKKLFIDAITCYEQAIKMDPDNPTYKEGYEEFLLRNKLKAPK
ncbi:MAG TPA: tetratricopeptide repeat protein [Cyclobacteriaceae bacterium]|nr:tetratricopeptide repeat protein [Cyclobacteriaceae bacterium]